MVTKTYELNQQDHAIAKERLRVIISAISSFLLSLALLALTVLIVIQWSGFSRSSFYKNMSAHNYYDNVLSNIYEEAESITLPTGLPVSVLEDIYTSDGIVKDVNGYIDASFLGETYLAETDEVADKLMANIRIYLNREGIITDDDQEANLKLYIDTIVFEYSKLAQMPLLSSFVKARNIYRQIFTISMIVCVVTAFICLFIILNLHLWLHRGIRYVVYAINATGLMSGILPLIALQSGFYKRIHLSPEYFYNFFTEYVSNILKSFLAVSVLWFTISAILIIVIGILKKRKE
jgi:hypothetical protein